MVVRFDGVDGTKTFRTIYDTGDGWACGDPPGKLPLYRGDDLAETVYVCEGEKAVDAARGIALCAVTSAHGSKSAHKADWLPLSGKTVMILPVNDGPGRTYADNVAAILTGMGCVLRIVALPELPVKGDVVDYIENLDSRDDKDIVRGIAEPCEATEVWTPEHDDNEHLRWQSFPTHVVPDPLRRFIVEQAKALGCDPSVVALSALTAVSRANDPPARGVLRCFGAG